jgi:hypothetical protein
VEGNKEGTLRIPFFETFHFWNCYRVFEICDDVTSKKNFICHKLLSVQLHEVSSFDSIGQQSELQLLQCSVNSLKRLFYKSLMTDRVTCLVW